MILQTRCFRFGFLALLVAAAGTTAVAETTVKVGLDFNLRVNETAKVRDTNLKVRFEGVDKDTRCPMDVQCVQAGDALITIELAQGIAKDRYETTSHVLHSNQEPKTAQSSPFTVTVLGLSPQVRSNRQIRPTDYIVTLRITRGK